MKTINNRTTEYDINDIFLKRYSSRAMSGEVVSKEELMPLLEAARWAPSAGNTQPWRFLYVLCGAKDFDLVLSFLNESNQIWCKNAGAFVVLLAKKNSDEGKPYPNRFFDAGSAWENFALQGAEANLVVHGMAGFSMELLKNGFGLSDEYDVPLVIAVGHKGKIEDLPEKLQEREVPNQRKSLEEIVFEGKEGISKL